MSSWDGYSKDIQDALRTNPAITGTIDNMIRNGAGKDEIMRITGAPYEVVDARAHFIERGTTTQTDSDRREYVEKIVRERKKPARSRIIMAPRTPEQQAAFNERMAKARAGRKPKT